MGSDSVLVDPSPKSQRKFSVCVLVLEKITVEGAHPDNGIALIDAEGPVKLNSNLNTPRLQLKLLFVVDHASSVVGNHQSLHNLHTLPDR